MKYFLVILLVVIFVNIQINTSKYFNTKLSEQSNLIDYKLKYDLPPDVHREFDISIQFTKIHNLKSAFYIFMIEPVNDTVLQEFVYYPGLQNEYIDIKPGIYFNITQFDKADNQRNIRIKMTFNGIAQDLLLVLFYSQDHEKTKIDKQGRLIYQSKVECVKNGPSKIEFKVNDRSDDEIGVVLGGRIKLECSSRVDHEPYYAPVTIEGLDTFEVLEFKQYETTKSTTVWASVSMANHGQFVNCKSTGGSSVKRVIKVYHRPTGVKVIPTRMTKMGRPPQNVSIQCIGIGGYPTPVTNWAILIGPHNASDFYVLLNQDRTLKMIRKPPPGSKWVFECSSRNTIPNDELFGPSIILEFNMPDLFYKKTVIIVVPIGVVLLFVIVIAAKSIERSLEAKRKASKVVFIPNFHLSGVPDVIDKSDSGDIDFSDMIKTKPAPSKRTSQVVSDSTDETVELSSTEYSLDNGYHVSQFVVNLILKPLHLTNF